MVTGRKVVLFMKVSVFFSYGTTKISSDLVTRSRFVSPELPRLTCFLVGLEQTRVFGRLFDMFPSSRAFPISPSAGSATVRSRSLIITGLYTELSMFWQIRRCARASSSSRKKFQIACSPTFSIRVQNSFVVALSLDV